MITNQYGDNVKIFRNAIYAHDSYFKALANIGSDFTILLLVVPMMAVALIREIKRSNNKIKIISYSSYGNSALLCCQYSAWSDLQFTSFEIYCFVFQFAFCSYNIG